MKIRPAKNRLVVKVLARPSETTTEGGIIIPEAKSVTKEICIGEVLGINDPEDVIGCEVGDAVVFRNMSMLECGDDVGILNVVHIDGILER